MTLTEIISKQIFNKGLVLTKIKLTDYTWHVRLSSEDLHSLPYQTGQHLRVWLGGLLMRTYSIWNYNPTHGYLDMAVCHFSDGPGSRWINHLTVGEPVFFAGPKGKFTLEDPNHSTLFLGDVCSLAHLYQLRRDLSDDKCIFSFIYSDTHSKFFDDLDGQKPFQYWQGNQADAIKSVKSQLLDLQLTKEQSTVYIAGEASFCSTLYTFFTQFLEWPKGQVKAKPFWAINKKGLE